MIPECFYTFILQTLPPGIIFAFGYGSAVTQQSNDSGDNVPAGDGNGSTDFVNGNNCLDKNDHQLKNGSDTAATCHENEESKMLDMVIVVEDSVKWHKQNLERNSGHYSILGHLGPSLIFQIQSKFKAAIYFNVVMALDVPVDILKSYPSCPRSMKYGVIQVADLLDDLSNWRYLYVCGRLHKPVQILVPSRNDQSSMTSVQEMIMSKIQDNYTSALIVSLLLLPDRFTEDELYQKIVSISYLGDFRMIFGEDKNKVSKIVTPSKHLFRQIYQPVLEKLFKNQKLESKLSQKLVMNKNFDTFQIFYTIPFLISMVQLLPPCVRSFVQIPSHEFVQKFTQMDALSVKAIISRQVYKAITKIVWSSSLSQGIKGFLTTGFLKAIKYCFRKIHKMYQSMNRN